MQFPALSEAGVVPEGADISSEGLPGGLSFDKLPSSARLLQLSHLQPLAREARVMRYREKKKTRKFEKTIRYASRKAYAESRPRIKVCARLTLQAVRSGQFALFSFAPAVGSPNGVAGAALQSALCR